MVEGIYPSRNGSEGSSGIKGKERLLGGCVKSIYGREIAALKRTDRCIPERLCVYLWLWCIVLVSKHVFYVAFNDTLVPVPVLIEVIAFLPLLPKVRLYGKSELSKFHADIESMGVRLDQLPARLGGTSTEPWVWGDGGDVPKSEYRRQGEDGADNGGGSVGGGGGGEGDGGDDDEEAGGGATQLNVSAAEDVTVDVPAGKTCIWEYVGGWMNSVVVALVVGVRRGEHREMWWWWWWWWYR